MRVLIYPLAFHVLILSSTLNPSQAFTTNFDLYWSQHPLRPEFAESTYFLYEVRPGGFQGFFKSFIDATW